MKSRLNERSVDLGRPAPIIVRHGFEFVETRSLETSLKTASAAVLLLERCEMLEELDGCSSVSWLRAR